MSLNKQNRKPEDDQFDDLLHVCWPHQECSSCLKQGPCSWCPTSSTCVPNMYKIHLLAPISNADICPLWSERWELRARCLGCHVSTITLLTCIVSVCSTFLVIGLVAVAVKAGIEVQRRWNARSDGWWKAWKLYRGDWWSWRFRLVNLREQDDSGEQRPLLGDA
ncbi:hypothetical protein M430DRAFT_160727 [Amorphotheca resinae ATCC 22711]|uniref:PSI domain-containing protein n=1 Tax=Amorphotheca resinae ATCC 22711 TaxID=857342 RepID=A0A2T3BET3_AMORE|nr:hypothetical protein M430DRAFT_160727 [Amorphotheca resinae ATCC 22711]PSS27930.1 hypothetical protein M430DRAFT_160727 [Amorphotheca resinae ATCC 22711]